MSTQSQASEDTKKPRQVILQDNSKIDIKEGNKKKIDKLQELHGFIKDKTDRAKMEQYGRSLKFTMDEDLPHTEKLEVFYDEELKEKDLVFKYLEVMTSELSSFNNDSKDSLKEALKYFDMIGAEERHEDTQTQIINDYSYLCAKNIFKFITTLKD